MGKQESGSKAVRVRQFSLMSQFVTVECIRQPVWITESRLEYFQEQPIFEKKAYCEDMLKYETVCRSTNSQSTVIHIKHGMQQIV